MGQLQCSCSFLHQSEIGTGFFFLSVFICLSSSFLIISSVGIFFLAVQCFCFQIFARKQVDPFLFCCCRLSLKVPLYFLVCGNFECVFLVHCAQNNNCSEHFVVCWMHTCVWGSCLCLCLLYQHICMLFDSVVSLTRAECTIYSHCND